MKKYYCEVCGKELEAPLYEAKGYEPEYCLECFEEEMYKAFDDAFYVTVPNDVEHKCECCGRKVKHIFAVYLGRKMCLKCHAEKLLMLRHTSYVARKKAEVERGHIQLLPREFPIIEPDINEEDLPF